MSSDHNKSPVPGASLVNQAPISESFNNSIELEDQIAALTPEARTKCRVIQELASERYEAEKAAQQRSHNFRVLRT